MEQDQKPGTFGQLAKQGPISYLKTQLKFSVAEWSQLTAEDREDLKRWAQEELDMAASAAL